MLKKKQKQTLCPYNANILFYYFITDDSDSSEEETATNDGKQHKQRDTDKQVPIKSSKRTLKKKSIEANSEQSNVIYMGHLPREFSEPDLMSFLAQFGRVEKVKLARSKKTNGSKGFAFVRFKKAEVANIAAEALSGYILLGQRRLVCHVVPVEKIHNTMFRPHRMIRQPRPKRTKNIDKLKNITQQLLKREKKRRETLKEYDYDFPGYEASTEREGKEGENSIKEKETK